MTDRVRAALESAVGDGLTPGAVCAVTVGGVRREPVAAGTQEWVSDSGRPIPIADQEPVRLETVYDIASVTKLFSAVTVLRLVDAELLDLDAPIGRWLTAYASGPKAAVTLRHLLSHTSGLPPTWDGWHTWVDGDRWRPRDRGAVLAAIVDLPLATGTGSAYDYSCLGYITAMACAEAASGRDWGSLVRELVIEPLGLTATGFGPVGAAAPTEFEPHIGRGMVRGVVHDETAFALEDVSANAGLFSTAADLCQFGEAMLDGFRGLLSPVSADAFWADQLPGLLAGEPPEWGQALGPRIGQDSWMTSGLRSARGHNGFTGPALLVERERGIVIALVTNRVHPSRETSDGNAIRAAVSRAVLDT